MYNDVVCQRETLIDTVSTLVTQGERATEALIRKQESKKVELFEESKRIDEDIVKERQEIAGMERKSQRLMEDLQLKTNNLNKLKHETAELEHEIESKRL